MFTQNSPVLIMLRLKQVIERTGLSRSTIYGKLDAKSSQYDPTFPTQVHLGNGTVRWVDAEVNVWLEQCVSAARSSRSKIKKYDHSVSHQPVATV